MKGNIAVFVMGWNFPCCAPWCGQQPWWEVAADSFFLLKVRALTLRNAGISLSEGDEDKRIFLPSSEKIPLHLWFIHSVCVISALRHTEHDIKTFWLITILFFFCLQLKSSALATGHIIKIPGLYEGIKLHSQSDFTANMTGDENTKMLFKHSFSSAMSSLKYLLLPMSIKTTDNRDGRNKQEKKTVVIG